MRSDTFVELMYRRLHGELQTADYIGWADALLEQGCMLPEIAEMASFAFEQAPDAREVERYFLLCAQQLGLRVPQDEYQATRDHWAQTCEQILDGRVGLDDGVARLHAIDNDCGYHLMLPWNDLSDYDGAVHWHDQRRQIAAEDINRLGREAYVRLLTRQFAALCRLPQAALPACFPDVWHCIACGHEHHRATDTAQRAAPCPGCGAPDTLKNMRYLENRQYML
ncbi:hypothetical protein [Janthinobacterium sp. RB2R34]|uniref:hypothetical protein n=1 Tax=Janthinobacterium sp. RB2R34 TaxID=3424193 RepID=UPI003F2852C4